MSNMKNSSDKIFFAEDFGPQDENIISYPTGFGNERYYWDSSSMLRHIPRRTKHTHPYSYDPIVLVNTGEERTGSAYSDRMLQWNYQKFRDCMGELNDGKGELAFAWSCKEKVQAFCQAYFDDSTLKVVKVVEMCNQSNGYPVWLVAWQSTKKEDEHDTTKEA